MLRGMCAANLFAAALACLAFLSSFPALAADADSTPIKIGLIGTFSGIFADQGERMRNGAELYMRQRDESPPGVEPQTHRSVRPYDGLVPAGLDWRDAFASALAARW